MANIKSQIKRNKQNEKARLRNKAVRSSLKTSVRKFREACAAGDTDRGHGCSALPRASSTSPPTRASSTRTRPPSARPRWPSGSPLPPDAASRGTAPAL